MSPSHLYGTEFLPYPLSSLFSSYPTSPYRISHTRLCSVHCGYTVPAFREPTDRFLTQHSNLPYGSADRAIRERSALSRGWAYRSARRLERGEDRAVKGSQEEASGARSVTRQMAEAVVEADGPAPAHLWGLTNSEARPHLQGLLQLVWDVACACALRALKAPRCV